MIKLTSKPRSVLAARRPDRTWISRIQEWVASRKQRPIQQPQAGDAKKSKLDPATCVPIGEDTKQAFVLGMHWASHLTTDSITALASKEAKRLGGNYIFARQKTDYYGVVNIEPVDAAQFSKFIPLASAFARTFKDKGARSVLILDMRESHLDQTGKVYVAVAYRGAPVSEQFCTTKDYFQTLQSIVDNSQGGANVYVDSAHPQTLELISKAHPSATEFNHSSVKWFVIDELKEPSRINITKTQALFVGALVIGGFGYTVGMDLYEKNIAEQQKRDTQVSIVQAYTAQRDQEYLAGYGFDLESGLQSVLDHFRGMGRMRNGWEFQSANCVLAEANCSVKWKRVYGTYDSFMESVVEGEQVTLDPADRNTISVAVAIKPSATTPPPMESLIDNLAFIKANGDRADTLDLGGVKDFAVGAMNDVVPWTGSGVPPGPVLLGNIWSIDADMDLVEEVVANKRLSKEFGLSAVNLTQNEGVFSLRLEGKIYVRK